MCVIEDERETERVHGVCYIMLLNQFSGVLRGSHCGMSGLTDVLIGKKAC